MQTPRESSVEIPVQIQQLAETRHMGDFLVAYPRKVEKYAGWAASLMVVCVGILGFMILSVTSHSPSFLQWVYYLLIVALPSAGIYLPLKWIEVASRQDQVALYTEGFISLDVSKATAYRWENIDFIRRGAFQSAGAGNWDIDRITVQAAQKTFSLDASMEVHARADICDKIERNFVSARLPQIIDQYNAGEEIAFGDLSVSQIGLRDAVEQLPWPLVERAEVGSTWVVVRKEGRTSNWYQQLIYNVPNVALLKALLEILSTSSENLGEKEKISP